MHLLGVLTVFYHLIPRSVLIVETLWWLFFVFNNLIWGFLLTVLIAYIYGWDLSIAQSG